MTTDIDNTIHYGSMPKQVKQQVTAGNPIEEKIQDETIQDETTQAEAIQEETHADQSDNAVNPTNA
jgi:hypothetical protein